MDLEELWRYRDLIVMFVKRNFTVMYKQTILGPLWIILNPLITTVLFNVVFGGIAGLSTDGTPSFLFYMAGNTVWTFFASCINGTANTAVGAGCAVRRAGSHAAGPGRGHYRFRPDHQVP